MGNFQKVWAWAIWGVGGILAFAYAVKHPIWFFVPPAIFIGGVLFILIRDLRVELPEYQARCKALDDAVIDRHMLKAWSPPATIAPPGTLLASKGEEDRRNMTESCVAPGLERNWQPIPRFPSAHAVARMRRHTNV